MTKKIKDETGNKYGRLIVTGFSHTNKHGEAYWTCKCECGRTVVVRGSKLRDKTASSCGCLQKEVVAKVCRLRVGLMSPLWKGGKFTTREGLYYAKFPATSKDSSERIRL